jgi:hypothetical protein
MESEGSLLHLQEPATCPYPKPAQYTPWPPIQLLENAEYIVTRVCNLIVYFVEF